MDENVLSYVVKKTKELINSVTCCKELKDAAQAWLDSLGAENEKETTVCYINELEEDLVAIDDLISFAKSDSGQQYFGVETAKRIVEHAIEIKEKGSIYCDCPACALVQNILEKKVELLK